MRFLSEIFRFWKGFEMDISTLGLLLYILLGAFYCPFRLRLYGKNELKQCVIDIGFHYLLWPISLTVFTFKLIRKRFFTQFLQSISYIIKR